MIKFLIIIWLLLSALACGFLVGYVSGYEHGRNDRW